MTKIKFENSDQEELVALLQRRGKINTENEYSFKWQSYSGLCEVTSYGKAEDGESAEQALKREVTEELGEVVCKEIFNSKITKIYENTEDDGDKQIIWATLLPREVLKDIELDISTGGMEIIKKSDLKNIKEVKFGDKKTSINNSDNITIFATPVSVIEKAFEIFE